jgi:FMN-dependent oxidoreductase (nitrilotriacetate monooxygenase family)
VFAHFLRRTLNIYISAIGVGEMIKLGVILDAGSHVAAWRHPDVPRDAAMSFSHISALTKIAERALFDTVFFADSLATDIAAAPEIAMRAEPFKHFEPMMLLAALATLTTNIGLISTATTTYYEPYHVARFFATLDHISNGRAGWNLVTSLNVKEAENFGLMQHPPRERRYDRAREFVDVVRGLWDSWEDDAFVCDKDEGTFFRPDKVNELNHVGTYFKTAGPLNVSRSPQGWPVITQAGSSEDGKSLGAETADVIFTAQQTLQSGVAFADDVRRRAVAVGRDPSSIKIMPGIVPFVGKSRAHAKKKLSALDELLHPELGLSVLSALIGGVDLRGFDFDGPLPELPPSNASQSRQALLVDAAKREGLTIRQLCYRACVANGHRLVFGTAEEIADDLEKWHRAGAADGFVLIPAWLPGGLENFTRYVVPVLQERGLYRDKYEGKTLRENLGIPYIQTPRSR